LYTYIPMFDVVLRERARETEIWCVDRIHPYMHSYPANGEEYHTQTIDHSHPEKQSPK